MANKININQNQLYSAAGALDPRFIVDSADKITSISNAYVGLEVSVIDSEENTVEKYRIKKINNLTKKPLPANQGGYELIQEPRDLKYSDDTSFLNDGKIDIDTLKLKNIPDLNQALGVGNYYVISNNTPWSNILNTPFYNISSGILNIYTDISSSGDNTIGGFSQALITRYNILQNKQLNILVFNINNTVDGYLSIDSAYKFKIPLIITSTDTGVNVEDGMEIGAIISSENNRYLIRISLPSYTGQASDYRVILSFSNLLDLSSKVDKVQNANGNLPKFDSNGNLVNSGISASSVLTSHQDISGKADKVNSATANDFAALDGNGNLIDSGKKSSDFATSTSVSTIQDQVTGIQGNYVKTTTSGVEPVMDSSFDPASDCVRFDESQTNSEQRKQLARDNIGALNINDLKTINGELLFGSGNITVRSAYEEWLNENNYQAVDHPVQEFLASLKAQFGSFVPALYCTDTGHEGEPGDSSNNLITPDATTLNYIYLVDNDANTPTAKTMWVTVVVDDSNPNNIEYGWTSIGDVQVDLTFGSGQPVNLVKIKDIDGEDDTNTDAVLNAEAGEWLKEQVIYSQYETMKGVVIGSASTYDPIRQTLKNVWLEVLDSNVELPEVIYFDYYRNDASQSSNKVLIRFQTPEQVETESHILVYMSDTVITGSEDIIISPLSGTTYYNKLKLHLSVDFTNATDINLTGSNLGRNVYISVADVNKSDPSSTPMTYLKEQVDTLTEEVKNMDTNNTFSEALKGVTFGNNEAAQFLKSIIKAVSVNVIDPNFNKTSLKISYFRNDSGYSDTYKYLIRLIDSDNNIICQFEGSERQPAGLTTVVNYGKSTYADQLVVSMVIDFPVENISSMSNITGVEIDLSKVNKYLTNTKTINDCVYDNAKPLAGKTIVCFGDSITMYRDANGCSYPDYIAQRTGANVINVGVGGAQLRQRGTPTLTPSGTDECYRALDICNMVHAACTQNFDYQDAAVAVLGDVVNYRRAKKSVYRLKEVDWSTVDAVTVLGGINDWNVSNNYAGQSGSVDVNYTLGAINKIIQELLETYPKLSIYWFTPVVHWADENERTDANWGDNDTKDGRVMTVKQWAATIENEVVLQHIPCCDLYNTLGWNKYNFEQYFHADGTHPNKGYKEMGEKIAAFIISNRTF